jgi:hypothetical protein
MSLLLNGAKTVTIAGTEMQCIEIYTGEAYTLPLAFKYANGVAINCTGWTLSAAPKWYTAAVSYDSDTAISVSNLTLTSPQPGAAAYANLTAAFTSTSTGVGYVYVPVEISGGFGSPPSPTPTVTDTNSILVVLSIGISRTDPTSGKLDYSREPLGMIVRYQ